MLTDVNWGLIFWTTTAAFRLAYFHFLNKSNEWSTKSFVNYAAVGSSWLGFLFHRHKLEKKLVSVLCLTFISLGRVSEMPVRLWYITCDNLGITKLPARSAKINGANTLRGIQKSFSNSPHWENLSDLAATISRYCHSFSYSALVTWMSSH